MSGLHPAVDINSLMVMLLLVLWRLSVNFDFLLFFVFKKVLSFHLSQMALLVFFFFFFLEISVFATFLSRLLLHTESARMPFMTRKYRACKGLQGR